MHIINGHFISDLESEDTYRFTKGVFPGSLRTMPVTNETSAFPKKNSPPMSTAPSRCCASWKPESLHLSPHRLPKGETRVCCEMQLVAKKGGVGEVWFVGLARLGTDGYSKLVLVGWLVCWLRSLIEVNPKKFLRNAFLQKKSGFREFLLSQKNRKVEEYWELPCNIAIHSYASLHF